MTDARKTPAGPAEPGPAGGDGSDEQRPRVVVRDKRRVDATDRPADEPALDRPAGERGEAAPAAGPDEAPEAVTLDEVAQSQQAEEVLAEAAAEEGTRTAEGGSAEQVPAPALGAELEALRADLDERTKDLQRLSAEYANYRKRVDRDRGVVAIEATAAVLAGLLPILDDLDRAREHGDLVGPFGSVAEQLQVATSKLGLAGFGEKGDPFDPTRHEAVAHLTSVEVTEPTCVDILRRGYLLGDKLLRPALVAVADPEEPA
ncbi:MAG: nucleotide exchange factor GrpE [Micromonosporaceae bacterium]|nr:nucleotide exchange factor GrpE [Micromonosporaceae bacterium]